MEDGETRRKTGDMVDAQEEIEPVELSKASEHTHENTAKPGERCLYIVLRRNYIGESDGLA